MIAGEGQVHAIGSRTDRVITVLLTDESGRPIEGASVSFHLPADGPTGTFNGGMKTDIATTGRDGLASIYSVQWNATPGPLAIRITAVKDSVRAGTTSAQYLAEASQATEKGIRGRSRWMTLGLVVAGAAAGGLAVGWSRSGQSGASTGSGAAVTSPPVQVGSPTITIGRP